MEEAMQERSECIEFETEDGEVVQFYVLEQTMLAGEVFLLVSESMENEAEAHILRQIKEEGERMVTYEIVEEEEKIEALSGVFAELLGDVEFEY